MSVEILTFGCRFNAYESDAVQVGHHASVLAESDATGHTGHFAPVRVAATPGHMLRARITGADEHGLIVEAA